LYYENVPLKEHKLRVLRKIEEVTAGWRTLHMGRFIVCAVHET
jgi:hypothetical protein